MEPDQQQRFNEWLRTKWHHGACPVCQTNSYTAGSAIFQMFEFAGGGLRLGGGPIYPVIPVVCANCGYTVFINAIVAGALAAPPLPTAPEEQPKGAEEAAADQQRDE